MLNFRSVVRWSALLAMGVALGAKTQTQMPEDKYLWLEDTSNPRTMEWVKAENARTVADFEADPRFATDYADALNILNDPEKLAVPGLNGDWVYNQWRDAQHLRGLLRRTTLEDYLTASPRWQPVLDIDELNRTENAKWVSRGVNCLYPGDEYCVAVLSNGGEDATTAREFNLKQAKFVPGGFVLDHSKQSIDWEDKDTLLVARDWGAGTLTNSGYPFVVKRWKRGTPLASAIEVFRGQPTDELSSSADVIHDGSGHQLVTFDRGVTFFTSERFVETPKGLQKLAIPSKASLAGMVDGRLLIHTREAWTPGTGQTIPAGSLVEVKLADVLHDPGHLSPQVVFAPTEHEFLQNTRVTPHHLLLTTLDNVQGRA